MSRIDLHTHSTASDGSLTPTELVAATAKAGIEILAITDHDTFDGIEEAVTAGIRFDVKVVPGVEFSVDHETGSLHLLGYGFDFTNHDLLKVVEEVAASRIERNHKMIERLKELGFRITLEDVTAMSGRGTLGRAHLAQWLVQSGQVESFEMAFELYLGKGRAAYVDRIRLSMEVACRQIRNAGGVSIWAHPGLHKARLDGMLERLPQWRALGLDGLESDYSSHTISLRDRIRRLAVENEMIFTGGSDFHGVPKPLVNLGDGPEGENIAEECWSNLEMRLSEIGR